MHRRAFLKSSAIAVSAVGAAPLLAACGDGGVGTAPDGTPAAAGDGSTTWPDGQPTLAPIVAQFELLTTTTRPVPFGLRSLENVPVEDADVEVYLRDLETREVVGGPYPTTYTTEGGAGGLYLAELELEQPGQMELAAVTADGAFGTQAVQVVTPENSQAPVAGSDAVSAATPTFDDDLGMATICTAEPQCRMHEVSLDDALEAGRPVMVLFATPAYCQTAVCGPAVEIVDQARTEGDWPPDLAWIHVEIYSDKGQTLADPVKKWNLPTEPWLFGIDAAGKITDRLDGPMLPQFVADIAAGTTAG